MISTKQAAERLNGICVQRVGQLAREGRIPGARRISGVWMFPARPTVIAAGRSRPGKVKMRKA